MRKTGPGLSEGPKESAEINRIPTLRARIVTSMLVDSGAKNALLFGEREGIVFNHLEPTGMVLIWSDPFSGETIRTTGIPALSSEAEAAPYDALASAFVLEQSENPAAHLRNWGFSLREGGTAVFVTSNSLYRGPELRPQPRSIQRFTPSSLRTLIEENGFETRELFTLIPNLRLPRFYRGDMGYSMRFRSVPGFRNRGMYIFLRAKKRGADAT